MNDMPNTAIQLRGISKTYTVKTLTESYTVEALKEVAFDIVEGEWLGIAGESGSGKSTLAKVLVRLIPADSGTIRYDFVRHFRKEVQMIFQNPYSSLNPLMTVGETLNEVIAVHALCSSSGGKRLLEETLRQVELPEDIVDRVPAQLSGGQRQRVAIARSLLLKPRVLICDEIVSSLDYPTGYKIIRLLSALQKQYSMTVLFITHNIQLLSMCADRIAVLLKGQLVELAPSRIVIEHPAHPYTQALVQAASYEAFDSSVLKSAESLFGSVISECPYVVQCPYAQEQCAGSIALSEIASGHWVRCVRSGEIGRSS